MERQKEITPYRGIDIYLNEETGEFQCSIEDRGKESTSLKAVYKFIDEYIKDNLNFIPFKVIEERYSGYELNDIRIVKGLRKDGKVLLSKSQFSDKQEIQDLNVNYRTYILVDDEVQEYIEKYSSIMKASREAARKVKDEIHKLTKPKFVNAYDFLKENYPEIYDKR